MGRLGKTGAILALAGVAGGVVTLAHQAATRVRVVGPSMEPALRDGDRVLVNRTAFWLRPPRIGEIVLARLPSVPGGVAIKRVAAARSAAVSGTAGRRYLLLGDNAGMSTDSRHLGAASRSALLGIAWYRYWPPERRGRIKHAAERPWPAELGGKWWMTTPGSGTTCRPSGVTVPSPYTYQPFAVGS